MAFGRQVEGLPTFRPRREFLWANSFKKDIGERTGWAVEKSTRAKGWLCSEGKMVLFSRSFIRKRAIALATTAPVAATSLVMAHFPPSAQRITWTMPLQYVADGHDTAH